MRAACWLLLPLTLAGCRDNAAAPISIVAGTQPGDQLTLIPQASLAEYIEISPSESALLLTFSSTERSCDSAPEQGGVTLAIRLSLPGGSALGPGSFPILPSGQSAERPHALPTVKLHGRRSELLPGGDLLLRQVDLSPRGSVSGLLRFEFPGDAAHPATRVSGRFMAHFCRINRLR